MARGLCLCSDTRLGAEAIIEAEAEDVIRKPRPHCRTDRGRCRGHRTCRCEGTELDERSHGRHRGATEVRAVAAVVGIKILGFHGPTVGQYAFDAAAHCPACAPSRRT